MRKKHLFQDALRLFGTLSHAFAVLKFELNDGQVALHSLTSYKKIFSLASCQGFLRLESIDSETYTFQNFKIKVQENNEFQRLLRASPTGRNLFK